MKKTIIELEDTVFDALEESVSVQGTTVSALSVRIVKDYVHSYKIEKTEVVGANARLSDFPWIGAGRSKDDNPNRPVSIHHDDELDEVYGEKIRKMRDYLNDLR